MRLFNRILAILTLFGVIVVTLLIVAALFLPAVYQGVISAWVDYLANSLNQLAFVYRLIWAGIGILIVIVCLLLILMELRPTKRPGVVTVKKAGGAKAQIAADSIAQRLEQRVTQIEDIVRAKPVVKQARGGGLAVEMDVETSPAIEVPSTTQRIQDATREVIEDQMGLTLKSLKVNMTHSRYVK
jgi:uncharacterized alkaline shock family protein YloU